MAKKTAAELREKAKQMLKQAEILEQQEYIIAGKTVLKLLEKPGCTIEEIRKALKK